MSWALLSIASNRVWEVSVDGQSSRASEFEAAVTQFSQASVARFFGYTYALRMQVIKHLLFIIILYSILVNGPCLLTLDRAWYSGHAWRKKRETTRSLCLV